MTQQEKELRDAAMIYTREFGEDVPIQIRSSAHDGFIKGAQWQSQQKQEMPELEEIRKEWDRRSAPYLKPICNVDAIFNFFAPHIKGTEWVSVKDRLPLEYDGVIAHFIDGEIGDINVSTWFDPDLKTYEDQITHWMPKPKAPKEVGR